MVDNTVDDSNGTANDDDDRVELCGNESAEDGDECHKARGHSGQILENLDSARGCLVHRPDEIVVEFGVVVAGNVDLSRFAEELGVNALVELVVQIRLDNAVPGAVEDIEHQIPQRHKPDYQRDLTERLAEIERVEKMERKDGVDRVVNTLQNALFEEREDNELRRVFADLAEDNDIVAKHAAERLTRFARLLFFDFLTHFPHLPPCNSLPADGTFRRICRPFPSARSACPPR